MLAEFCSLAVLKIAIVNVVGGLYFGYSIGYFGPYVTLTKTSQNCVLFQSEVACNSLTQASCEWTSSGCAFLHPCASLYNGTSECNADKECTYDEVARKCVNDIGYNAAQLGILSGASIAGSMASSMSAGFFIGRLGAQRTLLLFGLVAIIGAVMTHISRATGTYPLLVVGRVLIGTAAGIGCVACPMYCDTFSPHHVRNAVGTLFGISIPFGILLAALIGLLLDPDAMNNPYTGTMQFEMRLQVLNGFSTFFALTLLLVAFVIPVDYGKRLAEHEPHDPQTSAAQDANADETPTWLSMIRPLLVAVVMSIAQQFTGINAIIYYAPSITTNAMHLKPLLGNFLIMLWNFLSSIVSIFVASLMSLRTTYLVGTFIVSASCLITGIPVFPGVASEIVQNVVAGFGVFAFILAFEAFIGPPFYVLSQQLFPASFRSKGSSWTIAVQFLLNLLINVFFPIAVTDLSGGPGGNQNLGLGIVFIFFAACGILSGLVMIKFLNPVSESGDDDVAPQNN